MAVNAGLINSQIPMSAKAALPDIAGSYSAGITMRGDMIKQRDQEQTINRQNEDRDQLQNYLKSGGDIYTPAGAEKALGDLKGKVSSDFYMKLGQHVSQLKDKDIEHQAQIAKLDEAALGNRLKQVDMTLTYLAEPMKVYQATAATKGEPEALAQFDEARNKVIAVAAQQKGPNGQPLYSPQVLEQFKTATPDQIRGLMAGSSYERALLEKRYKESQITRNQGLAKYDEARADAVKSGKVTQGGLNEIAKIDLNVKNGLISPEDGQAMIKGIVAKMSKPGQVSSMGEDAVHQAAMDYYLGGTLPARLDPRERGRILDKAAGIAKEQGDTSEEASLRKAAFKSNQAALTDNRKRYSLTAVFERDADKRLGLVQELAHKADLSGVPALNRWIRAGRQAIAGDEDVNNLNSAMISAQAELAKVLSGALGNAGVSDAARQEAAQIINSNMSPEQIDSLIPNIRKELKFKMDAFKEQEQEILNAMKLKDPKAPLNAAPSSRTDPASKVSPQQQAENDKNRPAIYTREIAAVRSQLEKATGDEKTRLTADLAALERELKSVGGTAPAAGPAKPKTPAPQAAIDHLKAHPELKEAFKAKYGYLP